MATTPGVGMFQPTSASGKTVTELIQKAYRNEVFLQTVFEDPYMNNKDLIKPLVVGDKQVLAKGDMGSFILDVTPENTGARTVTLGFVEALDMSPIEGNLQFIGNEDDLEMKWTQVSANDWAGGLSLQNYGIDYRELYRQHKLNQLSPRLLYQWRAEIMGYYMREALCQGKSHNLTAAPVSESQGYNMNWYVPSLSAANQPAYNSTAATHATAIGTAIATAAASATPTIPRYLDMIKHLQDNYLEPVMIGGKPRWLQYVSPIVMRKLKDQSTSNSWAAYWKEVAAVQDIKQIIPQGEWIIDDKLVLIEDRRAPTVVVTGTASARTLTFGYMKAGRVSTRTSTLFSSGTTYYCDLNPVLGKGALLKYEPEKTHKEKQKDEYDRWQGDALFQAVGFYSPKWDVDAASRSNSTALQESSWIMATIRS